MSARRTSALRQRLTRGAAVIAAMLCVGAAVPAHAAGCTPRTSAMSPGDIAFSHRDYAKAESLYAAESQTGADADRAHAAMIRAELREAKVAEAEKAALAWSSAQPKNVWAMVAVAEVRWREGRPEDAQRMLDAARAADYCNAQAHADEAAIYRMRGMYASAERELTLAHRFDPVDDQIELAWIRLQPPAERLGAISAALSRDTWLSAGDTNLLAREKERALDPPSSSCHLVTPVSSTSIPFRGMQNGPLAHTYWGLNVAFDGKERRLEIDTGASGLVLSKAAAIALHLEPEATFKMHGLGDNGPVDSFVAKVHSIKIGGLEFQDCYVQVLGATPGVLMDNDGLIGGDVFSHFLLTLDFPGQTLKLDPLPARPGETPDGTPTLDTGVAAAFAQPEDAYRDPSMQDWDPIWRSGYELLMPVKLKPNGPWRLFLLDTGSAEDLISPDAAREVGKVDKGSDVGIEGVSGKVKKTWTTGPMKLYFPHFVAPVENMIGLDTSSVAGASGVEVSGLVGAPILHQFTVSIDYRDNLVHFAYDPKRIQRCVAGIKMADCY